MLKFIIRIGILLLLIAPFWGLLQSVGLGFDPEWSEFFWALKNTFWQALGSAVMTFLLGFIGALGLLGLKKQWLEGLLIAPSFLPSIYVILACLQMWEPFPMGSTGIIFVHTMMNFGIIAVLLSQIMQKKLTQFSETAAVLGSGFWKFLIKVVLPLLKADILRLGFFIFAMCFTSFSVPLIVGGGRGTTIEVLIFEKIRFGSNWNQAFALTLVQSLFLLLISLCMKHENPQREKRGSYVQILPWAPGFYIILILTLSLYGSFLLGFWQGLAQWPQFFEMKDDLLNASVNTYLISVCGGLAIGISYLLIAYLWPDRILAKVLNGYVAPSTVMIGFGLILLFQRWNVSSEWFRLSFGFWILFFPTLWRWGGLGDLVLIEKQIQVAEILGASRWQIFLKISFPQVLNRATWLSCLGAFWISGEFALSRMLMNQDKTLGLIANTMMSGYRLNLGTLICGLMLCCGFLSFLTLQGFQYVYSRKSNS